MKLQRYILVSLVRAFLLLLLVVTAILFLGMAVLSLRHMQDVGLGAVLRRLPFILPYALGLAIPLTLLVATLITYGKLAAGNELLAITMAGIHPFRTVVPALVLGLTLFLVTWWVNTTLAPLGKVRAYRVTKDDLQNFLDRIRTGGRTSFENDAFSMRWQRVDEEGWLVRPTFRVALPEQPVVEGEAERGKISIDPSYDRIRLIFTDLALVADDPGSPIRADRKEITLVVEDVFAEHPTDDRRDFLTSAQLRHRFLRDPALGRRADSKSITRFRVEYGSRIAISLASLVFVLIGTPVGMLFRRDSFVGAGMLAVGIAFGLFYPLHLAGQHIATERIVPVFVGALLPVGVVGSLGGVLLFRAMRR